MQKPFEELTIRPLARTAYETLRRFGGTFTMGVLFYFFFPLACLRLILFSYPSSMAAVVAAATAAGVVITVTVWHLTTPGKPATPHGFGARGDYHGLSANRVRRPARDCTRPSGASEKGESVRAVRRLLRPAGYRTVHDFRLHCNRSVCTDHVRPGGRCSRPVCRARFTVATRPGTNRRTMRFL